MKGMMNPACLSPLWHPWHPLWWMVLASKLLGIIMNIIIIIIIIINVLIIFIILVFVANHSNNLWLASWQHLWNENVLLLGRNASSLRWMVLASKLLGIIFNIIIFIIRIFEYLPLNNIAYWVFHKTILSWIWFVLTRTSVQEASAMMPASEPSGGSKSASGGYNH